MYYCLGVGRTSFLGPKDALQYDKRTWVEQRSRMSAHRRTHLLDVAPSR